ncbi:MAG: cysteine desulfurase/selenocysteine lyase [Phenylobacterium sp.]|jgi:cysteine desulfurase/selenocysteine lyase
MTANSKPQAKPQKGDFPILTGKAANHCDLVYLDNAATTQKPTMVIDAVNQYYRHNNANVHRAAHYLSDKATQGFEQGRETVRQFINARHSHEIIWTRGTTEAINLVAASWGAQHLQPGDIIVLSELEHHANIVPWQLIAQKTGAIIKPVRLAGFELDMAHYQQLLQLSPKLVALTHVSNAIGTINPIKTLVSMAKAAGAVTLVDGAQAISHFELDVQQLDCDFYVFSGHKVFGPTGIGVLYGKEALLNAIPPWQGGGEMINKVSFEHTTFNDLPFKFEAGTPNIAGVAGLKAAIDYLNQFDRHMLQQHEQRLFHQVYDWMAAQPVIRLLCQRDNNVGIVSFIIEDEHHQDIATLLDQQGIAVRAGHHCTMPLMAALGVKGTVRLSFSIYNDDNDVSAVIKGLTKVIELLV